MDVAPAAKRPCPDRPSAFDVLLGAAATASRGGILLHIPCVNMYNVYHQCLIQTFSIWLMSMNMMNTAGK